MTDCFDYGLGDLELLSIDESEYPVQCSAKLGEYGNMRWMRLVGGHREGKMFRWNVVLSRCGHK